jgi:hypothetical protein
MNRPSIGRLRHHRAGPAFEAPAQENLVGPSHSPVWQPEFCMGVVCLRILTNVLQSHDYLSQSID